MGEHCGENWGPASYPWRYNILEAVICGFAMFRLLICGNLALGTQNATYMPASSSIMFNPCGQNRVIWKYMAYHKSDQSGSHLQHFETEYSVHIQIHWAMPWAVPIPIGWPSWEPISPSCTMAKPCSRASRMKRLCWGKGSTKSNISKATPDLVDHPLPPDMYLYLYIIIYICIYLSI